MNRLSATHQQTADGPPLHAGGMLQRKCDCGQHTIGGGGCSECDKKKGTLQRKTSSSEPANDVPPIVHDVLRSPGQPLDATTRAFMEPHFRVDFSQLPVHHLTPQRASANLTMGLAGDSLEQEADQHADRIVSMEGGIFAGRDEPTLRHDFSQVRVHTDAKAAESARAVNAVAYTVGHDVVFGAGRFEPSTHVGRRLLAHELTHVAQQCGNAARVQRQEEEDLPPSPGTPRGPSLPLPDVIADTTALSEPHCPRTPAHLGNLSPTPRCPEDGEDIEGTVFQFCIGSDVFSDPADLGRLRTLVSGQPSGTTFNLRAYASAEGPGSAQNATLYNRNLSCHRLNRMIRELLNLGVQEQQIDAIAMGPTDRFGGGPAGRTRNRIAVILPNPPQQAPRADATGMRMTQIRDAAKQRIANGDYPLAADAYFARWSCGRWRTLAEAVARTSVLVEGTETTEDSTVELGTTSGTGPNTIILSPRIADAVDPIGCAANRIVDLTFHHFSRPVLSNFADQHSAGMHLVHLAGLTECRISLDPLNRNFDVRSRPNPVDPFTGFIPRCADQPLSGPLAGQRGPATMETPPNFTVTSLSLSGGANGSVVPSSSNPVTVGVEPATPFVVEATVEASGAPASIASFEIGFLQSVMAETWVNTHVDGRRERRRFPVPLRDGPPRNDPLSEPPWFDRNTKATAAPGSNQVTLNDAPNFRAFRFLPDMASSLFVQSISVPRPGGGRPATLERPTFQPRLGPLLPATSTPAQIAAERVRQAPLANNAPDRGSRVLDFNTWVVARRKNPAAPATHGATQFLSGLRLTFNLSANWSPTAGGGITGSGSFNVASRTASNSDADAMMLRGATPIDFVGPGGVPLFAEFLEIEGALPRTQAGGLARNAYFDAVRQIAQPERTGPTMRGEVILRIRVEVQTGRVVLDTPDLQHAAIRVLDTNFVEIDTAETRAFASAIFPEVRKLVVAPGVSPNEPQTGTMPVAVRLPRIQGSGTP